MYVRVRACVRAEQEPCFRYVDMPVSRLSSRLPSLFPLPTLSLLSLSLYLFFAVLRALLVR
jgi:hypothetical protein